jgi:hypothetical protein
MKSLIKAETNTTNTSAILTGGTDICDGNQTKKMKNKQRTVGRSLLFLIATVAVTVISPKVAFADNRLGAFTSSNGSFLGAEGGGGGALHANRPAQGPWERFTIFDLNQGALLSGDTVCLRTDNGHFVTAESGGGRETNANRRGCGPWERFQIFLLGNTPAGLFPVSGEIPRHGFVRVAFRASDGSWVVAEGGGGGAVNANRPAIGPWERWTFLQDALH